MTERIDHVAEARMHIDWAHDQQARTGEFDETVQHNATLAVAEATLALVEQQRIANLTAYLEIAETRRKGSFHFDQGVVGLDAEIREALGLS